MGEVSERAQLLQRLRRPVNVIARRRLLRQMRQRGMTNMEAKKKSLCHLPLAQRMYGRISREYARLLNADWDLRLGAELAKMRDLHRQKWWDENARVIVEKEPDGEHTIFIHVPKYLQQHRVYRQLWFALGTLEWPLRESRGLIYNNVIPRDILWFEFDAHRTYTFSRKYWLSERNWPAAFDRLRELLNDDLNRRTQAMQRQFPFSFRPVRVNSTLVNRYQGGLDSISPHADNEPFFGKNPTIVSLTIGNARRFVIKRKKKEEFEKARPWARIANPCTAAAPNKDTQYQFDLGDGDLLIMAGAAQDYWHHSIAKKPSIPKTSIRYNMTWRHFQTPNPSIPHNCKQMKSKTSQHY
jgi:alkylated DNA repair dioxygenase AlkB